VAPGSLLSVEAMREVGPKYVYHNSDCYQNILSDLLETKRRRKLGTFRNFFVTFFLQKELFCQFFCPRNKVLDILALD
jgi:4Fe-4S binding domain